VRADVGGDAGGEDRARGRERRSRRRVLRDLAAGAVARRAGALSVRGKRRADGRVGERAECGGAVPVEGGGGGGWCDAGSDQAGGVGLTPVSRVLTPCPPLPLGEGERREGTVSEVACRAFLLPRNSIEWSGFI